MAIDVGSIVEGVVTGITNFGAFIELPDRVTGLVHYLRSRGCLCQGCPRLFKGTGSC